MSKIETLSQIAGQLTEDQVEGLILYARTLLEEPLITLAPPEVLEDIRIGIEQDRLGQTVSAAEAFKRMQSKIDAAK